MAQRKSKMMAVLTNDIVESTKLSTHEYTKVMTALKQLLESQAERYGCTYEIFRGDSFQILYPDYSVAMQSTLTIRLNLQAGISCSPVKLTQSLAVDKILKQSDKLGNSLGEAFILSGRALDKATSGDLLVNFSPSLVNTDLSISTLFLRYLLDGLTEKQAKVLFYYIDLNSPEQKNIAEIMRMTRQNIATHLKRSGAELVKAYLKGYRELCMRIEG